MFDVGCMIAASAFILCRDIEAGFVVRLIIDRLFWPVSHTEMNRSDSIVHTPNLIYSRGTFIGGLGSCWLTRMHTIFHRVSFMIKITQKLIFSTSVNLTATCGLLLLEADGLDALI